MAPPDGLKTVIVSCIRQVEYLTSYTNVVRVPEFVPIDVNTFQLMTACDCGVPQRERCSPKNLRHSSRGVTEKNRGEYSANTPSMSSTFAFAKYCSAKASASFRSFVNPQPAHKPTNIIVKTTRDHVAFSKLFIDNSMQEPRSQ